MNKDQIEKEIIYSNLINYELRSKKKNTYQTFLSNRINTLAKEHRLKKKNQTQNLNFIDLPSYDYRVRKNLKSKYLFFFRTTQFIESSAILKIFKKNILTRKKNKWVLSQESDYFLKLT